MLNETIRLLECHEHTNFSTICTDATNLQIPEKSLDFVCTFNAIHHFDPIIFLEEASKTLKDEGYVFVYTRLKSQNARNIWGRFFPKFTEKEKRLYDLYNVEIWIDKPKILALENIRFFNFRRSAPLKQLIHKAKGKHYSTFSLYADDEFNNALKIFEQKLLSNFSDPEQIEWTDENVMLTFRKNSFYNT
jgi:SAM-dependent methyltransferase